MRRRISRRNHGRVLTTEGCSLANNDDERRKSLRHRAAYLNSFSRTEVVELLDLLDEKDSEIESLTKRLRWIADHDGGPERDGLFHDWEWGNEVPEDVDPSTEMHRWLNEALKTHDDEPRQIEGED